MKKPTVYTDNSNLYDADKAVKNYVKEHGKKLADDERDELGDLLEKRAAAMSDVLGVKISSVASSSKNKD